MDYIFSSKQQLKDFLRSRYCELGLSKFPGWLYEFVFDIDNSIIVNDQYYGLEDCLDCCFDGKVTLDEFATWKLIARLNDSSDDLT